LISYTATPIHEICDAAFPQGVRLFIKREDLNHPYISGNKWWKLKYNLARAREGGHAALLTFGGAYSNHLYATAAAAAELGIKSIGVVRGEKVTPMNSTLSFAEQKGMTLHFVSRTEYRKRDSASFTSDLRSRFGDVYLLPEGGTNAEAIQGCRDFGEALVNEIPFDIICLPVGTGGTLAGVVQRLKPHQRAIGFSVLKDGHFLAEEVKKWLPRDRENWRIETRFDFGGYAKSTTQLISFIERQRTIHNLPLDPVYTAKAMFGIYELIKRGEIAPLSKVLMVHTGGLRVS